MSKGISGNGNNNAYASNHLGGERVYALRWRMKGGAALRGCPKTFDPTGLLFRTPNKRGEPTMRARTTRTIPSERAAKRKREKNRLERENEQNIKKNLL